MGIDTIAVIIVGLKRVDLKGIDDLEDLIDDEVLEVVSPFYDGESKECSIVGLIYKTSLTYEAVPLAWDDLKIMELQEEFRAATGLAPLVWLTPMVY